MRFPRFLTRFFRLGPTPEQARVADQRQAGPLYRTDEMGYRATPENALKYAYQRLWVDPDLRATILDIRDMDRRDPRVKRIHGRTARATVKGGLRLCREISPRILRRWDAFVERLQLHRREKLASDARGLMMEGNLPLQWVLDQDNRVVAGVRMPSETLVPRVGPHGRFESTARAYEQYDVTTGALLAVFPLWRLSLVRLDPDNHDDLGSLGRPYLDAARGAWKKLDMTEEDMVLRRRSRAVQRMFHSLEGASSEDLVAYQREVERSQMEGNYTDYYMNRKGSVQAIAGDAHLDQIADVVYLLDTFFSGAPAPKGLFGYTEGLNRDILEDLKRDYFDEIDALQDALAFAYELGFRLDLLLSGINPDRFDFEVGFSERRTETPNQSADRALKYQALGVSKSTVLETAGLDPNHERERREIEARETDPYPAPEAIGAPSGGPRVSITPGNQPKGESGTAITNR